MDANKPKKKRSELELLLGNGDGGAAFSPRLPALSICSPVVAEATAETDEQLARRLHEELNGTRTTRRGSKAVNEDHMPLSPTSRGLASPTHHRSKADTPSASTKSHHAGGTLTPRASDPPGRSAPPALPTISEAAPPSAASSVDHANAAAQGKQGVEPGSGGPSAHMDTVDAEEAGPVRSGSVAEAVSGGGGGGSGAGGGGGGGSGAETAKRKRNSVPARELHLLLQQASSSSARSHADAALSPTRSARGGGSAFSRSGEAPASNTAQPQPQPQPQRSQPNNQPSQPSIGNTSDVSQQPPVPRKETKEKDCTGTDATGLSPSTHIAAALNTSAGAPAAPVAAAAVLPPPPPLPPPPSLPSLSMLPSSLPPKLKQRYLAAMSARQASAAGVVPPSSGSGGSSSTTVAATGVTPDCLLAAGRGSLLSGGSAGVQDVSALEGCSQASLSYSRPDGGAATASATTGTGSAAASCAAAAAGPAATGAAAANGARTAIVASVGGCSSTDETDNDHGSRSAVAGTGAGGPSATSPKGTDAAPEGGSPHSSAQKPTSGCDHQQDCAEVVQTSSGGGSRATKAPQLLTQAQQGQAQALPGQAQQQQLAAALKVPKLPMIRAGRGWYRGRLLRESQDGLRVKVDVPGAPSPDGLQIFWLDAVSDRIWRGSYKGKDWKYLGDGAWEPKPGAFKRGKQGSSTNGLPLPLPPWAAAAGAGTAATATGTDTEPAACDASGAQQQGENAAPSSRGTRRRRGEGITSDEASSDSAPDELDPHAVSEVQPPPAPSGHDKAPATRPRSHKRGGSPAAGPTRSDGAVTAPPVGAAGSDRPDSSGAVAMAISDGPKSSAGGRAYSGRGASASAAAGDAGNDPRAGEAAGTEASTMEAAQGGAVASRGVTADPAPVSETKTETGDAVASATKVDVELPDVAEQQPVDVDMEEVAEAGVGDQATLATVAVAVAVAARAETAAQGLGSDGGSTAEHDSSVERRTHAVATAPLEPPYVCASVDAAARVSCGGGAVPPPPAVAAGKVKEEGLSEGVCLPIGTAGDGSVPAPLLGGDDEGPEWLPGVRYPRGRVCRRARRRPRAWQALVDGGLLLPAVAALNSHLHTTAAACAAWGEPALAEVEGPAGSRSWEGNLGRRSSDGTAHAAGRRRAAARAAEVAAAAARAEEEAELEEQEEILMGRRPAKKDKGDKDRERERDRFVPHGALSAVSGGKRSNHQSHVTSSSQHNHNHIHQNGVTSLPQRSRSGGAKAYDDLYGDSSGGGGAEDAAAADVVGHGTGPHGHNPMPSVKHSRANSQQPTGAAAGVAPDLGPGGGGSGMAWEVTSEAQWAQQLGGLPPNCLSGGFRGSGASQRSRRKGKPSRSRMDGEGDVWCCGEDDWEVEAVGAASAWARMPESVRRLYYAASAPVALPGGGDGGQPGGPVGGCVKQQHHRQHGGSREPNPYARQSGASCYFSALAAHKRRRDEYEEDPSVSPGCDEDFDEPMEDDADRDEDYVPSGARHRGAGGYSGRRVSANGVGGGYGSGYGSHGGYGSGGGNGWSAQAMSKRLQRGYGAFGEGAGAGAGAGTSASLWCVGGAAAGGAALAGMPGLPLAGVQAPRRRILVSYGLPSRALSSEGAAAMPSALVGLLEAALGADAGASICEGGAAAAPAEARAEVAPAGASSGADGGSGNAGGHGGLLAPADNSAGGDRGTVAAAGQSSDLPAIAQGAAHVALSDSSADQSRSQSQSLGSGAAEGHETGGGGGPRSVSGEVFVTAAAISGPHEGAVPLPLQPQPSTGRESGVGGSPPPPPVPTAVAAAVAGAAQLRPGTPTRARRTGRPPSAALGSGAPLPKLPALSPGASLKLQMAGPGGAGAAGGHAVGLITMGNLATVGCEGPPRPLPMMPRLPSLPHQTPQDPRLDALGRLKVVQEPQLDAVLGHRGALSCGGGEGAGASGSARPSDGGATDAAVVGSEGCALVVDAAAARSDEAAGARPELTEAEDGAVRDASACGGDGGSVGLWRAASGGGGMKAGGGDGGPPVDGDDSRRAVAEANVLQFGSGGPYTEAASRADANPELRGGLQPYGGQAGLAAEVQGLPRHSPAAPGPVVLAADALMNAPATFAAAPTVRVAGAGVGALAACVAAPAARVSASGCCVMDAIGSLLQDNQPVMHQMVLRAQLELDGMGLAVPPAHLREAAASHAAAAGPAAAAAAGAWAGPAAGVCGLDSLAAAVPEAVLAALPSVDVVVKLFNSRKPMVGVHQVCPALADLVGGAAALPLFR